jgi:methylmalonyl-CoA mutase cobalamin-binding domain/chain
MLQNRVRAREVTVGLDASTPSAYPGATRGHRAATARGHRAAPAGASQRQPGPARASQGQEEVAIATPIRVLIAKVGLDGHDRGAKVVARALRDGGMDVIYTGLHRTPEEVVAAAVQEDVDVVGVSILSGAHMTLLPRMIELLRASDAADVLLVAGGVIPDEDVPVLRRSGVAEVFLQETPPAALVARVRELVETSRGR